MHGHEFLEGLAAIVLTAAGLVLIPAAWLARRRWAAGQGFKGRAVPEWPLLYAARLHAGMAAALALGATVIHFAVAPEHIADYAPFGAAFMAAGAAQLAMAIGLVTTGVERLRVPAIAMTVGALSIWAWSRTIGLPVGPHPWVREGIGITDSIAAILEVSLILVLLVPAQRLVAGVGRVRLADAMSVAIVPLIGSVGIVTLIAMAALVPGGHH